MVSEYMKKIGIEDDQIQNSMNLVRKVMMEYVNEMEISEESIEKFDPSEEQISFEASPEINLTTYQDDTFISKGNDLQAIAKGVDDSQFVINGMIISGV